MANRDHDKEKRMQRVDIRTWFREDIPAARDAIGEVYFTAQQRASTPILNPDWEPIEVRVDKAFIALEDRTIRYFCEVLATAGPKVDITLWLDPEGEPYRSSTHGQHLGYSGVLRDAVKAGLARLGRPVDAEAMS